MKLAIGTVQFGIQYGISNTQGIPSDDAIQGIFEVGQKHGLSCLDTALAYGNSEQRLGVLAPKSFKIITKFPAISSVKELKQSLQQSLSNLTTDSVYGYMAHNANSLIDNPDLWEVLKAEQAQAKTQKIGYSLYDPQQLQKLLDLEMVPDLVQIPYSILDRKFEKYLPVLHQLGTEIHVRSAFLQGLYFMNPSQLPEKLKPMEPALVQFHNLCTDSGVSAAAVALNYVYSNTLVDQVVIGVENKNQLLDNIDMISNWNTNQNLFQSITGIAIEHKELLNPVNW